MKKILFLLTAICLFAACDKKDSEQGSLPIGTAVSITEANFSPIGSRVQFAVSAESEWSISTPSWITASPSSGRRGTTEVTLESRLNDARVDRHDVVIVSLYAGSQQETIEVHQPTPYLEIDRTTIPYTWDYSQSFGNTPEEISVTSNIDWRLDEVSYSMVEAAAVNRYAATASSLIIEQLTDVLSRWLMCSTMNGTGDAVLTFIPATYNISDAPYSLVLRLSGPHTDGYGQTVEPLFDYELQFSQANLRFLVDVLDSDDDQTRSFAACNNAEVPFTVNSELDWQVQSKPDWVSVAPDAGTGSTSLSQSQFGIPAANPTLEQRMGEVVIVSNAGTNPLPERVITITQAPYRFDLDSDAAGHANVDTGTNTIGVTSSGAWQVDPESIPEWITVTDGSGAGIEYGVPTAAFNYTIPSQNLELEDRTATLVVKSVENGNSMEHDFTIRQDKFIFGASFDEILTMSTNYQSGWVQSSGDWAITAVTYDGSPVQDWLEFESMTGSAGTTFINYRATSINTSDEDRVAQVTVRSLTHEQAGITLEKTYEIKQRKYTFELTPAAGTSFSDVAYWTSTHSISLDASVNWTVETPDWVTASAYEGAGSSTIYFSLSTNTDASSRTGNIKITGSREDTFDYPISQSGYRFSVDVDDTVNVPVEPSSITFDVLSSGRWNVYAWEGDISFSPTNGEGRDQQKTVTASMGWNPELNERSMRVSVTDEPTGQNKTFTIVQAPYVFDSTAESFEYPTLNPQTSSFDVVCSGSWVLQNVPSWISVSQTSGSGNATLVITPQNNVNTSERSATFRVYSSVGGYTKNITVSQAAYEFDSSSESYAYAALDTKSNTINVTSTGAWSVVNAPSWLTFSKTSGASSDSFTITSTRNTSVSARSATFYVQADLNSSLRKQISVSQEAYLFTTNTTSLVYDAFAGSSDFTLTSTGSWTASSNQSWLTLDKASGTGNATITATISTVNPTASSRTATITLTSTDDSSRTVRINVTQSGYTFTVNNATLSVGNAANSNGQISLTSTGSWTASSNQSWLTVSPASGTGNATVTMTATAANTATSTRSATVTFTSTDDRNRTATVTVTQAAAPAQNQ